MGNVPLYWGKGAGEWMSRCKKMVSWTRVLVAEMDREKSAEGELTVFDD